MTDDPIKIILDTDIGDDIDDAVALAFVLGSPEFELLGVTVVYGDLQTRARIARKMLRLADPTAARAIPAAGVRWTAIAADVQGHNGLTQKEFAALAGAKSPLAAFLLELVVLMKRYKGAGDPTVRTIADVEKIHVADVMTAASSLIGDQMQLLAGRIDVDDIGGMSFEPDPAGPHRMANRRLEGTNYRAEIVRRILTAGNA